MVVDNLIFAKGISLPKLITKNVLYTNLHSVGSFVIFISVDLHDFNVGLVFPVSYWT